MYSASPNWRLASGVVAALFAVFSIFEHNFFAVSGVLNFILQTSAIIILGIRSTQGLIVGGIAFFLQAVIVLSGSAITWFVWLGMSICISMIAAASLGGSIGLENECLVAELRPSSLITTFAVAILLSRRIRYHIYFSYRDARRIVFLVPLEAYIQRKRLDCKG